jgi:hypothetical protein
MEKISGILPSNARVTTVDLRNAGTSRAGMPSFGRSVGISTVQQREIERATAAKANDVHKSQMNIRDTEKDPKAEIVQRLADDFFANKAKMNNQEVSISHDEASDMVVDIPREASTKKEEVKVVDFAELAKAQADGDEAVDENASVGQYLNVQA